METYSIIKEIDSNTILLDNLDDYIGKKVRIIIEPFQANTTKGDIKKLKGIFNKYADLRKIEKEKTAWEDTVKEKYDF